MKNFRKDSSKTAAATLALLFFVTTIQPGAYAIEMANADGRSLSNLPAITPEKAAEKAAAQPAVSTVSTGEQFFDSKTLSAVPKVIKVQKGQSIQNAITQAAEGDTIEIEAGYYKEALNLGGKKNLTLLGLTAVDGSRPEINANLMLTQGTTLRNLTFANPERRIAIYTGSTSATGITIDSVRVEGYINLGASNSQLINSTIITGDLGNQFSGTPSLTVNGSNNLISKNLIQSPNDYVVRVYSNNKGGNRLDGNTLIGGGAHNTAYGLIVQRTGGIADTVKNTIISGAKYDLLSNTAVTDVSYSLFQSGSVFGAVKRGSGILLSANPYFVNADEGDYRLQPLYSPAINAGDPSSPLDPDGTRHDLGAFAVDTRIKMTQEEMRYRIETSHGFGAGSVKAYVYSAPVKETNSVTGVVFDVIEVMYTLTTPQFGTQYLKAKLLFLNGEHVTILSSFVTVLTQEQMRYRIETSHGFGPGSVKSFVYTPVKRTANGVVYDGIEVMYTLTTPQFGTLYLKATLIFQDGQHKTIFDYKNITTLTQEQMRLAVEKSHGFGPGSVKDAVFTPVKYKNPLTGVVYDGIQVTYKLKVRKPKIEKLMKATLVFVDGALVTIADYQVITQQAGR